MADTEALNASHITTIGLIVIAALIVIGVLLGLIITAVVGRIIIAVVVVALGVWVWQQRTAIQDKIDDHKCPKSQTFFGITLDPPDHLKRVCKRHG